jgi:23S rRNA (pseudouridine1915-N3)-methyltransferase
MRWHLFAIGKSKKDNFQILNEDYKKRIKRKIPFDVKMFNSEEALLKAIGNNWEVVLLDAGGKEFDSSVKLSKFLENKIVHSGRDIVFVIGGAYGFGDLLIKKGEWKLSLSKLTMPHKMAKLFLLEQLYRSLSIIHKEPYNH